MAELRREEDLGTWVHSLDREVTSLGREQSGMRSTIDAVEERVVRMEAGIDKLIDLQTEKNTPMQLIMPIGLIATIVIVFGIFLELRLAPSELILQQIYENSVEQDSRLDVALVKQADTNATVKYLDRTLIHLDINHHKTLDRLREVETEAAKNTALVHAEYSSDIASKLADHMEKREPRR